MRERRLAVAALAGFALLGVGGDAPTGADARRPAWESTAALPDVAAPPPAGPSRRSGDPDVAHARARLARYAHRTGLTAHERDALAQRIVAEARRHGLDPKLVLAVMHIESLYDNFAVSDKDAMGLMQILPSTGAWLAPQLGIAWRGPQMLFDPIINVRLGVAYLRQLMDRYDGDVATALAAYNWGPGHIDGRLRQGEPLPTVYAQSVLAKYDLAPSRS
jgi:soluble lytic murein transglycosylase-like protein